MKKVAVFKKQRVSKVPIHLRDRIQKLLDVLKKYDKISPVNKKQLSTVNTFTNPMVILRKRESLKIVLDARYLNSMIDESKCNWPIEPVDVALTRINGSIVKTADLNSAYNQIPLDNESMRYTHFTNGNEQYCFKTIFLWYINWTSSIRLNPYSLLIPTNSERNSYHLRRRYLHSNNNVRPNVWNNGRLSQNTTKRNP